ncbi:MAG: nucleoside monophosphate kinase [Candidatus Paceibacterota bacterium]
MEPRAFLLYGKSGAGKGTQAELLKTYLRENDPKRNVLSLSTGEKVRALAKQNSHSAELIKEVMESGGLMPAFVPVMIWASLFIENASGDEHFLLDGLTRRPEEAPVLEGALLFYERVPYDVIVINVSDEEATKRLLGRGRLDDRSEEIKRRLNWYEELVVPTIDFFRESEHARVHDIHGEQSEEDVYKEILNVLFNDKNNDKN